MASSTGTTPSWAPSVSISRTGEKRICSLTRGSLLAMNGLLVQGLRPRRGPCRRADAAKKNGLPADRREPAECTPRRAAFEMADRCRVSVPADSRGI